MAQNTWEDTANDPYRRMQPNAYHDQLQELMSPFLSPAFDSRFHDVSVSPQLTIGIRISLIARYPQKLKKQNTPLLSPSTTPAVNFQQMHLRTHSQSHFSPLTSPAMTPLPDHAAEMPPPRKLNIQVPAEYRFSEPSPQVTPLQNYEMAFSLDPIPHSLMSPPQSSQLNPQDPLPKDNFARLTPAQLMHSTPSFTYEHSNRSQPYPPQNIESKQNAEPVVKKTSHKVAEQRRRDILKNAFKKVKEVLPRMREKAPSKVAVLKFDLQHAQVQHEKHVAHLQVQIDTLSSLLRDNNIGICLVLIIVGPALPRFRMEPRNTTSDVSSDDEDD